MPASVHQIGAHTVVLHGRYFTVREPVLHFVCAISRRHAGRTRLARNHFTAAGWMGLKPPSPCTGSKYDGCHARRIDVALELLYRDFVSSSDEQWQGNGCVVNLGRERAEARLDGWTLPVMATANRLRP